MQGDFGNARTVEADEYEADADEVEFEEHSDFMSASVASTAATATTTKACFRWDFYANHVARFAPKCTGLIHRDEYDGEDSFHIDFSITCAYPMYLEEDDNDDDDADVRSLQGLGSDAARSIYPTAVMEATISINTYYPIFNFSSAFSYLKFMESWMVVARHLRDDAIESIRFHSRCEKTYLLVEVGLTQEMNVGRGVIIGRRSDVTDTPINNTVGFALVPLVDQQALFTLFTTHSTSVQFLTRDGHPERLPPADYRVVRISVLDLGLDRVMKLGEGYFVSESYEDEDPFDDYNSTYSRNFALTKIAS